MNQSIDRQLFEKAYFSLWEETFEKHHGFYLDKGTSLFETLQALSAEEASKPAVTGGNSIAGHVEHVRFYLKVLEDSMRGRDTSAVDWTESWKVKSVTADEWKSLKQEMKTIHSVVSNLLTTVEDWNQGDHLSGALSVLVHTAYHLGAIRQILRVNKG